MSENTIDTNPETVYWINSREYSLMELILKKLHERYGQGTYISKKSIPFITRIPVVDIDSLPDELLKDALHRQLGNIANNDPSITIPFATVDGRALKQIWHLPKPILSSQCTSEDNKDS